MKNINSNWLGTPPEHWKALKLRQILRPFSEKNHADLQLLSVVREKGVIVRDTENDDNHNYMPRIYSALQDSFATLSMQENWLLIFAYSSMVCL